VFCVLLSEFMHGIGADRYVYFYLAVEVWLIARRLHTWFHTILYDAAIIPLSVSYCYHVHVFSVIHSSRNLYSDGCCITSLFDIKRVTLYWDKCVNACWVSMWHN